MMAPEFCLSYTTDPQEHLAEHLPILACDWIAENDGFLPGLCCRDCIYNIHRVVAIAD